MRPLSLFPFLALLLAAALAPVALPASDWPSFLGPTHDGKSTEKLEWRDWPEDGPPVLWHIEVGEGYSMPSIADGRLFLFDRGGDEARLRALDAATGKELWQSTYPTAYEDMYGYSTGPRASPVIDGERVYAFGVDGRLRCHQASDGKVLWEVDTMKRFGVQQNFFGVGSTPLVEGDLLIVPIGGSPPESKGIMSGEVQPNGTGVVAFDKKTGEERWKASDELASYSSPVPATIGDRRLIFYFARGGLLALEPKSGAVAFHFPWRANLLESVNAANPVIVDDKVLVTETYGPGSALIQVTPEGYEVLRKDPPRGKTMANHWSTPVYHEGVLYGSSGRSSGDAVLRAIDFMSGETKWEKKGLTRSTLLYADGHFLVLTEYGRLILIEATPERYSPVAEVDLGKATDARPALAHPAWNAPVLVDGRLYVRGKHRLLCLDLRAPAAAASKGGE